MILQTPCDAEIQQKSKTYFEESDEDDSSTPKLSKKAQVLEDYFIGNNTPAARPSTSRTRSPLLPTR